jgi:hypothetical protein
MITFTPDAPPVYSHTIPEAPAGSSVEPPPLMPTAFGRPDVPRAESTVPPEGHDEDAVVVVIVGAAVGAAVAIGAVAAGVGVDPELELAAGDELPQAVRAAKTARVARGIQYECVRVTWDASVIWAMSTPPAGAL